MIPETKPATTAWKQPSSPPRRKFNTTIRKESDGTVFSDLQGVLLVDFLICGVTVNTATIFTDRLRKLIHRKRPGLLSKGVLSFKDNARSPMASITRDLVQRFRWEVLERPPYSPDLTQCDFNLFWPLKKHMECRYFRIYGKLQQAVLMSLHNLDADFLYASLDTLVYRWNNGDYVRSNMYQFLTIKVYLLKFVNIVFLPENLLPYFFVPPF